MVVYDNFIDAIVGSKKTRNWADSWSTKEISAILEEFAPQFLSRSVRVALCKIKPDKGKSVRWLEFVDLQEAPDWASQFDVTSKGESELKTYKTML